MTDDRESSKRVDECDNTLDALVAMANEAIRTGFQLCCGSYFLTLEGPNPPIVRPLWFDVVPTMNQEEWENYLKSNPRMSPRIQDSTTIARATFVMSDIGKCFYAFYEAVKDGAEKGTVTYIDPRT